MRDGKEAEGFHRLLWGITGEKPEELDEDSLPGPALQRGNADTKAPASTLTAQDDQPTTGRSSGQDGIPTQGARERETKTRLHSGRDCRNPVATDGNFPPATAYPEYPRLDCRASASLAALDRTILGP